MTQGLPEHIAIVVLGPSAAALGRQLQAALPGSRLHGPRARSGDYDVVYERASAHLADLFAAGRPIVGICASGILIRALAPLLAAKQLDAAGGRGRRGRLGRGAADRRASRRQRDRPCRRRRNRRHRRDHHGRRSAARLGARRAAARLAHRQPGAGQAGRRRAARRRARRLGRGGRRRRMAAGRRHRLGG